MKSWLLNTTISFKNIYCFLLRNNIYKIIKLNHIYKYIFIFSLKLIKFIYKYGINKKNNKLYLSKYEFKENL